VPLARAALVDVRVVPVAVAVPRPDDEIGRRNNHGRWHDDRRRSWTAGTRLGRNRGAHRGDQPGNLWNPRTLRRGRTVGGGLSARPRAPSEHRIRRRRAWRRDDLGGGRHQAADIGLEPFLYRHRRSFGRRRDALLGGARLGRWRQRRGLRERDAAGVRPFASQRKYRSRRGFRRGGGFRGFRRRGGRLVGLALEQREERGCGRDRDQSKKPGNRNVHSYLL
jgi:hypothetical protein